MADESSSADRTEQPTPHRLQKAREEGQIPQSNEVGSAMIVISLLITLAMVCPSMMDWFVSQMQEGLSPQPFTDRTVSTFGGLLQTKAISSLVVSLPFLLSAAAISIAASVVVGGWSFSPKAVGFKFERLSPMKGLKGLFSGKSTVQMLTTLTKLVVLTVLVYLFVRDNLERCIALRWSTPMGLLGEISRLGLGVMLRIAVGLSAIAALELVYQRYSYKKQLRMSRNDIRQEAKQYELAPEVRGRIRQVQRQLAQRRMLQDVQHADVILANPTHVSVALKYDNASMAAPVVVAKGADLMSEKIKEIGRAHNVPIVYRPELARAIFRTVEVGEGIPQTLFVAVAEVLAMIYRLRRRV